jgi:hypothetical protein
MVEDDADTGDVEAVTEDIEGDRGLADVGGRAVRSLPHAATAAPVKRRNAGSSAIPALLRPRLIPQSFRAWIMLGYTGKLRGDGIRRTTDSVLAQDCCRSQRHRHIRGVDLRFWV